MCSPRARVFQEVKIEAAKRALAGQSGEIDYIDYRGKNALASFQPIQLGNFEWGLVAKIDTIRHEIPYTPPLAGPEQRLATSLQLLNSTPGFAGLPNDRLEQLLVHCPVRTYAADEVVLHQQMPLDGLYLILAGEAELVLPDAGGRSCSLGILERGEYFGEKSSLLHGRIAETTVRAGDDLEVLVIPCERLQELLVESPRLGADLAEVIEIRRRAAQELLQGPLRGSTATPLAASADDPVAEGAGPAVEPRGVG